MPLNSFLTRLIWWCVTPIALLAAFLAINDVLHEHDEHDREALRIVKALAETIDHDLGLRISALQILALSPLADDSSRWSDFYQEAQGFRQSFGSPVIFTDLDRHIHFNTRMPLGTSLPMLPPRKGISALQVAEDTARPAVSDMFRDPFGDEMMVAVVVPGLREGKPAFLMATALGLHEFQNHLDRMDLYRTHPGWSIALFDSTGATIARRPALVAQGVHAVQVSDSGKFTRRFSAQSSVSPWSVALEIPRDVYLAPLLWAAATLAIAVLGLTLVGVLGGTFAARRLGKAVRSLAEAPVPGAPPPDIAEFAVVRGRLDESITNRDKAESARRDAELRFRTSLEQASRALELSEARLRGIFESANDAIITADESQTVVMANPAAGAMFRCPLESMLGAPLERFIAQRHREAHRHYVQVFGESEVNARPMARKANAFGLRSDGVEFPIDAAISQLKVGGQRLYTVMLRDVTELKRTQSALLNSYAGLQRLFLALDRAQENERKRIALELHDDLQQTLAAISINVAALGDRAHAGTALAPILAELNDLAASAIESTRRIVSALRPQILEDLGLVAALEVLARQFGQRNAINCEFEAQGDAGPQLLAAPALATSLYRVAQEALNNVAKHAHASQVRILLASAADGRVVLSISDNGIGMSASDRHKPDSFGLAGMHERVHALGGELRVDSSPGSGTVVEVHVALEDSGRDLFARRESLSGF
ncbi:MAG: PAS domain-containing sensor histidine kinase [Burkholderiaceae bacterium]